MSYRKLENNVMYSCTSKNQDTPFETGSWSAKAKRKIKDKDLITLLALSKKYETHSKIKREPITGAS